MSDEQAPPIPALRLKPRLRSADGQAPAGIPAASELPTFTPPPPANPDVATAAAEIPKIRFKPRLVAASPESAEAPAQTASAVAPAAIAPASAVSVAPPAPMDNPRVVAPSPTILVDPANATVPPLFVSDSPAPVEPAAPISPAPAPAAIAPALPPSPGGDAGKFKLKPKSLPLPPPAGASPIAGTPPPVLATPPSPPPPPAFAPVAAPLPPAAKSPPPFPVMAPPGSKSSAASFGATTPPMDLSLELTGTSAPPARTKKPSATLIRVAVLVVLIAGGFFAWTQFAPDAPAPTPEPKAAPAPKAPVAVAPKAPQPSDSVNALAHAPANAIKKAQDAIAAHDATRTPTPDAAPGSSPQGAAPTPTTGPAKQPAPAAVATATIAPGVAATAPQVAAVPEASAPFRSFVANAKVSGVFQGPPTRAMINGRLTRTGEVVDTTLGISFNGVDSERRNLLFVDRTGATVTRRF